MQRYVWISECGSRNLPSPLKSPGVGIVAPIVLALGGKKQIEKKELLCFHRTKTDEFLLMFHIHEFQNVEKVKTTNSQWLMLAIPLYFNPKVRVFIALTKLTDLQLLIPIHPINST